MDRYYYEEEIEMIGCQDYDENEMNEYSQNGRKKYVDTTTYVNRLMDALVEQQIWSADVYG